jgi:FKBP-type peptidyl-prolyl cis-trans isomerase (trigger factor)
LQRELDTQKKVRKLLNNLDNTENLWAPNSVIESQAELLNYKKTQILNNSGIRNLILRRNKLSDGFASLLA